MVSENSPSISNSSILHQFLVLNSIADQNQFENQHFVACGSQSHSLPLNIQSLGERMPRSVDLLHAPQLSNESVLRHVTRSMNLLETSAARQAQRLSLSLGSVMDPGYIIYYNTVLDRTTSDYCFAGIGCAFIPSAAMGSSKFLKPAQSLLEEMVNIGSKEIDTSNKKYMENLPRRSKSGSFGYNEELSEKPGSCFHLLKFLALLQEVERRYDEYYIHMEELVSCFEAIAGGRSWKILHRSCSSSHVQTLLHPKKRNIVSNPCLERWKQTCQDMGVTLPATPTLYCDNQAALHIAANPLYHQHTKHIEIDYHLIREKIKNGVIRTEYIPTTEQLVDVFTKDLSREQHSYLLSKIGVLNLHQS